MSQRMRAIENDIKRLTASLSETSTVNTNSIVRINSDVVRASSVSRGNKPRVSVAHPSPKPNTILVMGDSNTRYVNLGGARVSQVPTLRTLILTNARVTKQCGFMWGSIV